MKRLYIAHYDGKASLFREDMTPIYQSDNTFYQNKQLVTANQKSNGTLSVQLQPDLATALITLLEEAIQNGKMPLSLRAKAGAIHSGLAKVYYAPTVYHAVSTTPGGTIST